MLIMLFIIGLVILTFGIICYSKQSPRGSKFFQWIYNYYWMLNFIGGILISVAFIAIIFVAPNYSNIMVIDDKIALYEEENANIEQNIGELVENYKDYESSTFENFKLDNLSMLFSMYPELKSNELATKQIDLYISNNTEIKKLKETKLDYEVYKWWLFF